MENISEALLMAGNVLLFIIAISFGLFTYNNFIAANANILTASQQNTRAAEKAETNYHKDEVTGNYVYTDTKREYTGPELAWLIINHFTSNDGSYYSKITVQNNSAEDIFSTSSWNVPDGKYNEVLNSIRGQLQTNLITRDDLYIISQTKYNSTTKKLEVIFKRKS